MGVLLLGLSIHRFVIPTVLLALTVRVLTGVIIGRLLTANVVERRSICPIAMAVSIRTILRILLTIGIIRGGIATVCLILGHVLRVLCLVTLHARIRGIVTAAGGFWRAVRLLRATGGVLRLCFLS